ncbi:IS200/IS605 family element transposase accessory protein TnpB [Alkalicella caledoniensis]|uniref:IS200/IS605 family element transposase accessory protein TnpB n=1 Tax=Alkalicella caledoniensis TaxID=2731377 RepID=A0A7G9W667_ALKCA|nr:IS200/IS605 family element RNA-guided endonuclease TnpB [Alkalicella caledoniensis]QNO14179.1 IS200/IS605 family element transposase accessory protein TnpB [Alkalicella caledoniensis]
MLKAYKYRIYPNEMQKKQLAKTFGCARFVYNYYLAEKIKLYKDKQESLSKIDCNNHLNRELKKELIWLKEVDKFALTNSIYNLDTAYQHFFRRVKQGKDKTGFPRFKSRHSNRLSYTTNFTNNNIKIDFSDNKIKLPKLKWIESKVHREFDGKIKSANIVQNTSGRYFVSILVDTETKDLPLPKVDKTIGLDLGISNFLIDSDGNTISNPKILYKHERKLAKLQRQLAKKQKTSNNRNKMRIKVARLHEKISDTRRDFLHKLSKQIINENQVIVSEDLNVRGMVRNHKLAKAISDVSWSEFTRQLEYKANWYCRTYVKIDRLFPSSQLCSHCGFKNTKTKSLSVREWTCDNCGNEHDRDINASRNILQEGLRMLA